MDCCQPAKNTAAAAAAAATVLERTIQAADQDAEDMARPRIPLRRRGQQWEDDSKAGWRF